MEVCAKSSHSNGPHTLKYSKSANEVKRSNEKAHRSSHSHGKLSSKQTSTFVNHAEHAWHEDRRKWVGDKSQHPPRMTKDPIISWSTSYDDLLSTNEPFAEPIPLPNIVHIGEMGGIWKLKLQRVKMYQSFVEKGSFREMVDFLVDVWLDEEGIFD